MTCPTPERLAEAVTGSEGDVLAHAAACAACQALLDDQRAMHDLVAALPDVPLTRARRENLAAETLARADQRGSAASHTRADVSADMLGPPADERGAVAPPRRRWTPIGLAVAAVVAAAVGLGVMASRGGGRPAAPVAVAPPTAPAPARPVTVESIEPSPSVPQAPVGPIASEPAPPSTPRPRSGAVAARIEGGGEFSRTGGPDRDVVTLARGDVTVDSIGTRGVSVIQGDTAVVANDAKAQVVAKRGVIAQVTVFAGSVEVTVSGKRVVIEQGMTWDRNAAREDSLAAFRTGWEALRAGDNAAAIAAFDLATDDVVAEDALYWGAVANERIHDTAGALARYRALVERFPKSPRVAEARAAIARLAGR